MTEESLIIEIRKFMEELGMPDWLIEKSIEVLERKAKTMGEDDLYSCLEDLGQSSDLVLPEAFLKESWLKSVYTHHCDWIAQEVKLYVELTQEPFESHVERCPLIIKGSNKAIQETYLAVSATLINIFAQMDQVRPRPVKKDKKDGFFSKLFRS